MAQGSIAAIISCSYVAYLVVQRPAVTPLDNVELITLNVLVVVVNILSLIHRVTPSDGIRSMIESLDTCSLLLGCLVALTSCLKLLLRLLMALRTKSVHHVTPPTPVVDAHLSTTETAAGRHFTRRADCWWCAVDTTVDNVDPMQEVLLCDMHQQDVQCDEMSTKGDLCEANTVLDDSALHCTTSLDAVIDSAVPDMVAVDITDSDSAVFTLAATDSLVVPPTKVDHNLSLFNYLHMAMPDVPPPPLWPAGYDDL